MKRLFLVLLTVAPFLAISQTLSDVYNISTSYYQGTAKSMAMGNAMGAVGQDFSSISINPAGLGLFRKPTFIFTPSIITSYTETKLNGYDAFDTKAKLSVNNLGYVGINNAGNNTITWAVGMNRTNNYNNNIYIDGYNDHTSLVDAYIAELADNGIYDDKQIISSSWIDDMTKPRIVENNNFRGMDYSYLWWIIDRERNIYAAIGNSGNVIYVNPEKNIVIAVSSYFKPTIFDRVDFIQEYIEPFIVTLCN